uniref:Cytosol aminopeptidase domain-containing protein n=1 Tax=Setaria digitata TaxID=48799 RepID=A0A915PMJ2_9BILA
MSSVHESYLTAKISAAKSVTDDAYDGIIFVTHSIPETEKYDQLKVLLPSIITYCQIHKDIENAITLIPISANVLSSKRLIVAGTGPVDRDYDDVRRFGTAARNGMKLALKIGMKKPLILTLPHKKYPQAELVSAINAMHELYIPLHIREEEKKLKVDGVGFYALDYDQEALMKFITTLDAAFTVCRDIGDSDPQRMSPPCVADYVTNLFSGTKITTRVISDVDEIKRDFPLMAAVNRAANSVKDHQARLIWLEYNPEGSIDETIMLVGKGVTIDTGGADLKINGNMFGMCRDKYGAAVVAGIFKTLEILQPKNVKFCGFMCMVRNSIGSNSYTCDEIIRSRSGKRIAICNTDAEGRITMLDPLTKMAEIAKMEKKPRIFTLATLTGHCILTYGHMAAAMDNGPAHLDHTAEAIRDRGDAFGQPVEVSRLHSEDFEFHEAESEAADLRQSNTLPSVRTPRGHQGPAAFLLKGSRLDEHGLDSENPIAFTHIDMGACMGSHPQISFPNPLMAFAATYVFPHTNLSMKMK